MNKMQSNAISSTELQPSSPVSPKPEEYLNYVQKKIASDQDLAAESVFLSVDEKMQRIKEIIDQIANANVPVMITGESGTGKEVIARAIHSQSNRRNNAFVAINCAALPSSLLESELFGFEKGAFTGAHQRHLGKFEQADKGTLLLDEITEIEPNLQAKLLRALQEKEIERIGGSGPVNVDARIITTTNRDVLAQVASGNFRNDLYYRLYVIHLEIPPLRERRKDIELLAKHFLQYYAREFGKNDLVMTSDTIQRLIEYSWPGNVRELQNVMQRAVVMAKRNIIHADELPLVSQSQHPTDWIVGLPIGKTLRDVETQLILQTLKKHNGNRTHAAKTLGISLRTLRNKINEFTQNGFEVTAPTTGKAL